MNWHREIDYHGSRSYGADGGKGRRFGAIAAWLAKLGGRKAPKPIMRPRPSESLTPDARRAFFLLGPTVPTPAQRPADCPFPLKPGQFEARDWRLLP